MIKKLSYLLMGLSLFSACSENKVSNTPAAGSTADSPVVAKVEMPKPVYAYPVKYSEWEIGNPENIKTVLDFYKAWDTKQADKVNALFADTLRLRIPTDRNEFVIPNKKINTALGENRKMYDSASNNVISAVSLHDKESNEDWVMITTYNKWIEKNGKRDSLLYQDNWRLKNGKLSFLMSFYKLPSNAFVKKNDPKQ